MQGSSVSDSERDIHIGNLAGITSDAFPSEFCYVALGHIHRPQKLNKEGTVRYSGSPIPLSFSERKDQKTVVVITLAENELKEIESIEVPSFRKLIRYTGSLQEIEKQVAQHSHQSTLEDWLEIQVEEQEMNPMLREQFEAFIEKTNKAKKGLYIIRPTLRFINNEREEKNTDTLQTINDMTPSEVFAKLLDRQKVTDQEVLKQTFEELLDLIHHQTETSN